MSLFIRKVVLFFTLPVVIMTAVFFISSSRVKQKMNWIAKSHECLIMGDSQIQRINPEYFKSRTFNFGSSGEHYFFTYSKLKRILAAEECNIKVIVLGVSVHNFAPVYQRLFDLNYKEGKSSLNRYFYFFNFFEEEAFHLNKLIVQKDFLKGLIKMPEWNGFKESTNKNPGNKDIERILDIHYKIDPEIDFSRQDYFLQKIIQLCKERNIKILAVSTPLHAYYKSQIPDLFFNNFYHIMEKHRDLTYLSYLDIDISGSYMSDGNHLNKEGAAIYSGFISKEAEKLKAEFRDK